MTKVFQRHNSLYKLDNFAFIRKKKLHNSTWFNFKFSFLHFFPILTFDFILYTIFHVPNCFLMIHTNVYIHDSWFVA